MLKFHGEGTMRMLPPEEISHMYTNTAEQNIEISTRVMGKRIMLPRGPDAQINRFCFQNKQNEEECNHRRQLHELRTLNSTSLDESKAALQQNQRSTRIGMQQQLDTAVMRLSCIRCSTKYKLQPTIKPCESPTST